jgi:hypothetical protein
MKYMLLIYGNEAAQQAANKADSDRMIAAYRAYREALQKAGVPYAETKEQLGGYYMIDVPDLDAALSWAGRCPGASHGVVEVRPIWAM